MKPNNPITRVYGLDLSRRRAVVGGAQRSVFFHHMEVQVLDTPSILPEVPQLALDPRNASLSPPLQKTEVFVYSTVKRNLKMWLEGDAQTRLANLSLMPLLANISTPSQTDMLVLPMRFSILPSWYV